MRGEIGFFLLRPRLLVCVVWLLPISIIVAGCQALTGRLSFSEYEIYSRMKRDRDWRDFDEITLENCGSNCN